MRIKTVKSKILEPSVIGAIEKIQSHIETGSYPSNKELIEICAAKNINLIGSRNEAHLIHEILETAVNRYLFQTFSTGLAEKTNKLEVLEDLENLTKNLPTQSWRGEDQLIYQQFSTPPPVAFVMAQLLKPEPGNIALEPSAGTGCLALWLNIAGCQTVVNEISERRRQLLEIQNHAPTAVDAEFLDDLLPDEIKPDLILMNPPFSAGGGRITRTNSNFGFKHVESALERLNPGGRLVALLGAESCLETDKGRNFWRKAAEQYEIRCFLKVPPKAFYKYGTTFPTVAVLVGKPETQAQKRPNRRNALIFQFNDLSEMMLFISEYNATDF